MRAGGRVQTSWGNASSVMRSSRIFKAPGQTGWLQACISTGHQGRSSEDILQNANYFFKGVWRRAAFITS
jgi:hypothetical protein